MTGDDSVHRHLWPLNPNFAGDTEDEEVASQEVREEEVILKEDINSCRHLPALVDWPMKNAALRAWRQEILQAFTKTQDISLPADCLWKKPMFCTTLVFQNPPNTL